MSHWDRSRHRRERRYHAGYPPLGFYDGYDGYGKDIEDPCRYDRISVARPRRRGPTCYDWCPLCVGDYREPYELLRRYDPLMELMEEIHDCWIAMETGQFIAQDAADRIEEASKMVNRMFGYDPTYKQFSALMKQLARDVQLMPGNAIVPYHLRPRRRRSFFA
ncbi:hypothetical protein BU25DRAFT_455900 [Macroventuria anomochaeta]|uniref:Uncharacterized protein n=1 Tax=Macroventuria anomochaeta TaxID=301207 RepID=A0ACB6SA41_9PLEO|nr:uncharacterized protein BU25DRAFT_455900 [Macroventuria anomochaeta]KAF2630838.1 hypothetical protein BU25DRAFT_455900 [Macroventuria anomochaeta]